MAPQLLLVEDDSDSLFMLRMILERVGFDVVATTETRSAQAELARGAFELVLADLMVDSHDPVESWRAVDDLVRLAGPAPVGLLTAWPVTAAQLQSHGVAFALVKPCSSETVLARVGSELEVAVLPLGEAALLRTYFARLEQGDWDGVAALCTDDVLYHLPSSHPDLGNTVKGRSAFREFTAATFANFREPTFVVSELRALPRGAVVRYVGSWRGADGRRQQLDGAVLFVLRDGLISEIGVRLDPQRLTERERLAAKRAKSAEEG
ncbi:MAG: nuclear transport factor 2 family protein [Myxococcota bacterium]|nr:nuclear transport factor 2 family protein [Myxococcota bacterium]